LIGFVILAGRPSFEGLDPLGYKTFS